MNKAGAPFVLELGRNFGVTMMVSFLLVSCSKTEPQAASFIALPNVDSTYGRLITVANHPTSEQYGTGERIGFFEAEGTIWGLPLALTASHELLICVAPELAKAPVTDTIPKGVEIIGATNEPTGWRGGTGRLELVARAPDGSIRAYPVNSRQTTSEAACWAQVPPGPRQRLHYYRIGRGN